MAEEQEQQPILEDQLHRAITHPDFAALPPEVKIGAIDSIAPGFKDESPELPQGLLNLFGYKGAPLAQPSAAAAQAAAAPKPPPPPDVVDPATRDYYAINSPITLSDYAKSAGHELMSNAPMIGGALLPMAAYALAPATGGLSLIGAAALGGIGGRYLQYATGNEPMPQDIPNAAIDLGKQGATQAAYEIAGEYGPPLIAKAVDALIANPLVRGVTRVAGPQAGAGVANAFGLRSLVPTPPPVAGTTILGRTIPESLSQTMQPGRAKTLAEQAEHYMRGTFPASPLRDLAAEQQGVTRELAAGLANDITGGRILTNPNELPQNFDRAAAYLQGAEQKLRQQVTTMSAPQTAPVAQGILKNAEQLGLDKATRNALRAAGGTTTTTPASPALLNFLQGLYGKPITVEEAIKTYGQATLQRILPEGLTLPRTIVRPATMSEAMYARDELSRLAGGDSRSPAWAAWQQMSQAINSDLGPTGQAAVRQADQLARQQAISREMSAHLMPMYLASDPTSATQIAPQAFVKMVNDMQYPQFVTTKSGSVMAGPSKLEQLYPGNSPEAIQNRQAWIDLGSWWKRAGATQAGRQGFAESFARIGMISEVPATLGLLTSGHPIAAVNMAAPLVTTAILSHAMANPAGAQLVLDYFRAGGSKAAGPLAARIIAMATGIDPAKTAAPQPMPSPTSFEPAMLPAHSFGPQNFTPPGGFAQPKALIRQTPPQR